MKFFEFFHNDDLFQIEMAGIGEGYDHRLEKRIMSISKNDLASSKLIGKST